MDNNSLTHSAISISLVLVSFILFRGAANIVNSITVPIIFYLNYAKFDLKKYLLMILTVFILSFLFFFQQLFFIIFYAIMGGILYHSFNKEINFIIRTILFAITFLIGFIITITTTDIIIGTALRAALAAVVAGSKIGLIFLYLMTSVLVAVTLSFVGYQIDKRFRENFF